jgi:hypothetical protein
LIACLFADAIALSAAECLELRRMRVSAIVTYSDALSRPEMHDKPQSGMETDFPQHPEIFITDINILKNILEGFFFLKESVW